MAIIFKTYEVINNSFKGNGFNLRFAGNDTNPVFVAKDVITALGYHPQSITSVTRNLPGVCEIDRLKNGYAGNHIMVGITKADVEILLSRKQDPKPTPEKAAKKAAFREFWNNEVLPQIEYPELRKKITNLAEENARLKAEIALLRGTGFTPEAS